MIPRVAQLGYGFAGAGKYYLNDKRDLAANDDRPAAEDYYLRDKAGRQTSERVGFTATLNLPTQDPQKALRCMAWLAANSGSVKQAAAAAAAKAAGMSYADYVRTHNPFRGRKQEKPLYTLSLAWHPTRNKRPTKAQMLAAADEVLGVLGMRDRQVLMVEHTDTPHPHLHLIVNRVSPHNGKFAAVGNDYLKLSRWALDYEKRTGQVLCFGRELNWEKRDAARLDKGECRKADPKAQGTTTVLARDVPRRDHDWFRSVAHLAPDEIRKARGARQQREREQLTAKLADRTMALEGRLTRRYGLILGDVTNEIGRLQRAEHWRRKRDQHPLALVLSPRHAFHALVDLVSGRKYFRPRRINALERSAQALRTAMNSARRSETGLHANAWRRQRNRHEAERARDNQRIAALGRSERGNGSTETTRQVFSLRGAVETARQLSPKSPAVTLSDIRARVAENLQTKTIAAKSALAGLINAFGGNVSADVINRQTLGGWQGPLRPPASPPSTMIVAPPPIIDQERPTITRPERKPQTLDADTRVFEARRDALLKRIESDNEQQKRRRRKRPRGKSRRYT